MIAGCRDRPAPTRAAGLLLLLTPVIWGATFPAAKVALRDVSPWTFVAWSRGLGLLAIVVVLTIWRPPRVAWTRGLVPAGALLGGLMTAGYLLQTVGINHTSSTNAAFITVLYVVLAPAGAALIGRHSPDRVDVACLALALVGLGLLSIRGGTSAPEICWCSRARPPSRVTSSPSTCSSTDTPPRPSRSPRWRHRRC